MGTKCNICGNEITGAFCMNMNYTMCNKCWRDIELFRLQPDKDNNLYILLEVFSKRGTGEDITYEELHNKKSHFKLIKFEELYKS